MAVGNRTYDVIIVGGGVMGCSIAYSLTNLDPGLSVLVIERDPTYEFASSTLSLANVRIQFSLKENIQMSRYTLDVLETFGEDMAVGDDRPSIEFRREGNLFLVDNDGEIAAREAFALQKGLGCEVRWWLPEKIRERYPLYETGDLLGGAFGLMDGHLDAYAMLMGYKSKARQQGTVFLDGEVMEVLKEKGRTGGVRLASGERIASEYVVNCAGAWAAQVAGSAGIRLPIQPVKRQVFVLDTPLKIEGPLPLTVLPSGLYFRTEGDGRILLGKSMAEDPVGFDFNFDRSRFMKLLWPELARFVPAFDRLKLVRGWAGLYAVNTLDGNAILGEWPELPGLFLANGFSGHGLQQAPAVGRYLAEGILGRPHALDLSIFSPLRVIEGKPLSERGLV